MVKINDRETRRNRTFIILAIAFLICFLIRLPFLLLSLKGVNSDIAMTGLMGLHILRGDFPVFWWGQGYMAPVDSYLNAIVTYIFGVSNINSQIIHFFFSLFFPFTAYLLAKEAFNREVAILSFIFTAITTWFFTVLWGYMVPISIGNLLLLLTIRLFKQENSGEKNLRIHIILGFLAGLGFWINWVILPYLATAGLFLFLKDRIFFLRRPFFYFLLSFLIGSLPFWIFNLNHDFWTFSLFQGAGERNPVWAAKLLVFDSIPLFLGLKYTEYPWSHFTTLLGIIYILLFLFLLFGIFRSKNKKYISVLIVFTLLVCISFVLSRWGGLGSPRYLFQLYSVIPIAIALSLSALREKSPILSYIFAAIIITANIYAEVDAYSGASKPSERDPDTRGLISFLKSKGIRHAYSDYSLAPRLTFEAKEDIICAEPTTERYKKYKEILDSSNNFAYVFRRKGSPLDLVAFEANIKAQGISLNVDDIGSFRVFHSFSPPSPREEMPRSGWRAESSLNSKDTYKAFDGDVETAWFSGEPKKEGMWFKIDLGSPQKISGISLLPGLVPEGGMLGYSLEVSVDGKRWRLVSRMEYNIIDYLSWYNGGLRFDHARVKVAFDPINARYIKITHHGKDKYYNWTIAEVFVYKPVEKEIRPYDNLINEGKLLEAKGDYRGAAKKYLEVIKADRDNEEGYCRLMSLMQDLFIPFGPLYEKAGAFERAGLIEKAIENYEYEYKRLYPSGSYSSYLLNRLAYLYEKAGDIDKSDYYKKRLNEEFSPSEKRSVNFGGLIEFLGYDIKDGRNMEMVYYWKVKGDIKNGWNAFVHFIGPDGKIAFQNDHLLFSDERTSSKWVKGEIYKERSKVKVPEDLRTGTYEIKIGLFDPRTEKRLKVKTGSELVEPFKKKKDEVVIGELRISD